mgnify:CR=1 FL=1
MRKRISLCAAALVLLSGCADMAGFLKPRDAAPPREAPGAPLDTVASGPVEPAEPPPVSAVSEEDFDTTSEEERKAAAEKPASGGEMLLGTTVASLGDPAKPGFWLETPLVDAPARGRVEYPANGKSAQVELIPIEGPGTAGSRISLPAMRLIEAPLTELPELRVFRN